MAKMNVGRHCVAPCVAPLVSLVTIRTSSMHTFTSYSLVIRPGQRCCRLLAFRASVGRVKTQRGDGSEEKWPSGSGWDGESDARDCNARPAWASRDALPNF